MFCIVVNLFQYNGMYLARLQKAFIKTKNALLAQLDFISVSALRNFQAKGLNCKSAKNNFNLQNLDKNIQKQILSNINYETKKIIYK